MKNIKRITALILSLVMLLSVCSCGKEDLPEKQVVENVFKMTKYPMPGNINYVNSFSELPDGYLIYCDFKNEDDNSYRNGLVKLDNDFNFVSEIELDLNFDEGDTNISSIAVAPDSTMWAVVSWSIYEEATGYYDSKYYIVHIDDDFKVTDKYDAKETLKIDSGDDDFFYISNFVVDKSGNIAVTVNNNTFVYLDSGMNILYKSTPEDIGVQYFDGVVDTPRGVVLIYRDENYDAQSVLFDSSTRTLSEPFKISAQSYGSYIKGSGDYDFYFSDDKALYGYKIETAESEEVMNFLNSDIMNFYSYNAVSKDDGSFVCAAWDEESDDYNNMIFIKYTPVPDSEVKPKYIITLAGMYIDYQIRRQVLKFNRASEEYRIVVNDYSSDIDYSENSEYTYDDAITKLNNDIASGIVPDLFVCSSQIPFQNYADQGLFEDINKYLENDGELSREMFEANVLKAYEYKGKLYRIAPSFSVITFAAKPEMLGEAADNWNMESFMKLANSLPEGVSMFQDITRDNMLEFCTSYMYDEFVDPDTGKCNFDDGRFANVLEFVSKLSNKSIWDDMDYSQTDDSFWEEYENAFSENKVVLSQVYMSSFDSIVSQINYSLKTLDFELVGFPTEGGGAVINDDGSSLAISSKSKVKDGAWEFIRSLLSEEYQDSLQWNFPLRTASLEKAMKKQVEQAQENKRREEGGDAVITPRAGKAIVTYPSFGDPGNTGNTVYLDDELANKVLECIRGADSIVKTDTKVKEIINEESARFFEGQCTSADAAKSIQSRVSIYLSENS